MGQVIASPKRAAVRSVSVHADSAVSMQCLKHHHHFGACKCHQFGTVISNGFSHKSTADSSQYQSQYGPLIEPAHHQNGCVHGSSSPFGASANGRVGVDAAAEQCNLLPLLASRQRLALSHSASSYSNAIDFNGNVNLSHSDTNPNANANPSTNTNASYSAFQLQPSLQLQDGAISSSKSKSSYALNVNVNVSSIAQSHTFPSNGTLTLSNGETRTDGVESVAIPGSRSMTFENRPSRADSGIASLTSVLSKRLSFLNLRKTRDRHEKHRSMVETSTSVSVSVRDLQTASRTNRHSVYCNPTSTSLASLDPPSTATAASSRQNGSVSMDSVKARDADAAATAANTVGADYRSSEVVRQQAHAAQPSKSNGKSIIQNIYFWRHSASSHRLATAASVASHANVAASTATASASASANATASQTAAQPNAIAQQQAAGPQAGITHQYKQVIPKSKSCYNIKQSNAAGVDSADRTRNEQDTRADGESGAGSGSGQVQNESGEVEVAPRRTVLQASTSELLKCLSEFLIRRCKRIVTLKANDPVYWMRAIDKRLILQGWADITFVNPANVVFVYLLLRDIVSDETRSVRELQHLIFTSLYLAYAYMGNEISYPLKPFLLPDDDRDRFWERCLAIIKLKSADMLRINAEPAYFAEVFAELKCYSVFV